MLAYLNSRPLLACGQHLGCSILCEKRNILFMMTAGGQSHFFGYVWGHPSTTQKILSHKTEPGCSCPLDSLLRAGPTSTPYGFLVTASEPSRALTMALWIPIKCLACTHHGMGSSTDLAPDPKEYYDWVIETILMYLKHLKTNKALEIPTLEKSPLVTASLLPSTKVHKVLWHQLSSYALPEA